MRVMTFNMNGIRSAFRKGFREWFLTQNIDVLCVQETKAQLSCIDVSSLQIPGYTCVHMDAEKPGYSGVAIFTRIKPDHVTYGLSEPLFDREGRYICCRYGDLDIVSLYLPSGSSGEIRQTYKYKTMDVFWESTLLSAIHEHKKMIICGDWNIAHREIDIKNWRGNLKNSGFLPEERQWIGDVMALGWVDTLRHLKPEEALYTWWSFRGAARAKNVGWRIDYQMCTPNIANTIKDVEVFSQPLMSDHAPMVVSYDQSILES